MKILVVAESIDVEDSSGSKANVALIQNLQKAGFENVVYHYSKKNIQLEGIPCVSIDENRHSPLFFLSRFERYARNLLKLRLHMPLQKLFGFSFTLFNDRNSIVKGLKNINDFNPHFIITLSKGGSFRPHHAVLRMPEFHSRWIAYMHDPYPMHLYPRPFAWVEPGYFQKWKFINNISEKAAFSAFPSKLLMEWMGSYFPKFIMTGFVIPHQISDLALSEAGLPVDFKPEKFNLLHAGTLLTQRNPKALVEAFDLFLKKNPSARTDARLWFIGGENIYSAWLRKRKERLKELEISNGYVSFEEVRIMQQHSSVNIILEAKSEISPFLPGKFPHCVQAKKTILLLGPELSESRRLLGKDYRYWTECDDVEKITMLLEELYSVWKSNPENLVMSRPDLEAYLSAEFVKKVVESLKTEIK